MPKFVVLLFFALLWPLYSNASERLKVGLMESDAIHYHEGRFVSELTRLGELYNCVFKESGFRIEVQTVPAVRLQKMLEYGDIDLGLPFVQQRQRDQYAVFTRQLFSLEYFLFSQEPMSNDISTVGVIRGSTSAFLAKDMGLNTEHVGRYPQLFKLLESKRIDAAIIPKQVIGAKDLRRLEKLHRTPLQTMAISLYISKKAANHRRLVSDINSAIDRCN